MSFNYSISKLKLTVHFICYTENITPLLENIKIIGLDKLFNLMSRVFYSALTLQQPFKTCSPSLL